jgi:hypothetical protein
MLPNFFVVGAQKCGTTSLHTYLEAHPAIYLPEGKETKFFADDARYAKGVEYYQQHWFSGIKAGQLVGEVDPDYMYFDAALDRMADILDIKSTKFLFVFREPVSRAFSHYLMTYRRGLDPLSFEEAIAAEPARIRKGYYERLHYSYMDRGYYYRQVMRFLERVDREQMLFILTEDLAKDADRVMTEVFQFLGIEHYASPAFRERQLTARVPKSVKLVKAVKSHGVHKNLFRLLLPVPAIRKRLRQGILSWNETDDIDISLNEYTHNRLKAMFLEENMKLSKLIDRDLAGWF